jgi:general secretion pathway protein J
MTARRRRSPSGSRGAAGEASAGGAGFTLIEIMIALAILTFITSIMWGSFSQTAVNKRVIEGAQDRAHTVRVALLRMARELEMSFIADENTSLSQRRTMFDGAAHGDVDELTFSAFAHQRLRAGLNEGDTTLITYFGERDPDDRRILNLMRRETRRLQVEDPKAIAGESYVLCPDVSRVKFTYYDYKQKVWENEWSTLSATGFQYPPSHVRITLTVIDERGQEVSYSTDARIQMTERVGYRPVPN